MYASTAAIKTRPSLIIELGANQPKKKTDINKAAAYLNNKLQDDGLNYVVLSVAK